MLRPLPDRVTNRVAQTKIELAFAGRIVSDVVC